MTGGWWHQRVNNPRMCLVPGEGSREVAGEMVRTRMHQLLQILLKERRVELWCIYVGGILLRTEALQGQSYIHIIISSWCHTSVAGLHSLMHRTTFQSSAGRET